MTKTHIIDNRFFNEVIVRDECGNLARICGAIPEWESLALKQLQAEEAIEAGSMTADQRLWRDEYINNQHEMLAQTVNTLYAGLAVIVAAAVENTMAMLCREQGVTLRAKATWGHKQGALETVLKKPSIEALSGFDNANRARLLGNCFKHESGKTNDEWVKHFAGSVGEELDYAGEDWKTIIHGVREFLLALVDALPPT